ncbi:MAG: serine protease [Chitinophagaceae bacterium]|jgi:S1-C subfamily serine protease|nr:serine protease [Chitinophagaceae bacterium]
MMEDIYLLEAIERYFNNEMSVGEKISFEELRSNNSEVDQMVIEHKTFLHQTNAYADNKVLKHTLHTVYNSLSDAGEIGKTGTTTKSIVLQFWNRYKKVAAIAASIAGITALTISSIISSFTPNNKNEIQQLSRDIQSLKNTQIQIVQSNNKLNEVVSKVPQGAEIKSGGTAFMIDNHGYLITNAHVLKVGNAAVVVTNNKGQEFSTHIAYVDAEKDLAILKIADEDFKSFDIPYTIVKKNSFNLGQEIFTLGYPKNEVVYNTGYLSARSGYGGDTSTVQLSLPANPGNSGGPVFNKNGDVVGILSTRETQLEGVTFAIKSKKIYQLLDAWHNADSSAANRLKLSYGKGLKGMDREDQIAKLEDCVFLVKVYN